MAEKKSIKPPVDFSLCCFWRSECVCVGGLNTFASHCITLIFKLQIYFKLPAELHSFFKQFGAIGSGLRFLLKVWHLENGQTGIHVSHHAPEKKANVHLFNILLKWWRHLTWDQTKGVQPSLTPLLTGSDQHRVHTCRRKQGEGWNLMSRRWRRHWWWRTRCRFLPKCHTRFLTETQVRQGTTSQEELPAVCLPMSLAWEGRGRRHCVTNLNASKRISMMLLIRARRGARGNAATKMVVKPNCRTETKTNQEEFINMMVFVATSDIF